MVNPDSELLHLIDLMPASGRMLCKLASRPEQPTVIDADLPKPWAQSRPIFINFDLWARLSRQQRDLLLLRTVAWLNSVQWLKVDVYQGAALAGVLGTLVELSQGDLVGAMVAGGLTGLAGLQIVRSQRSSRRELEADEAAIRVAQRRGYTEVAAARALLDAVEATALIERRGLNFTELLRCQNLRAIAGTSTVGVPDRVRDEP
jgi:hypothetical protein